MYEKKTMWYADFAYPQCEARPVTTMCNCKTGEVELYCQNEDNEWSSPADLDKFYNTVEEANDALEKWKQSLHGKMKETRQYITIMKNWSDGMKEDDPLFFSEDDYQPYRYSNESYYKKRYNITSDELDLLLNFMRTGFINIHGDSFKKEDVESIKWGKSKAEISLECGKKVETHYESEFVVVGFLFGQNVSCCTYKSLDMKAEEEANK